MKKIAASGYLLIIFATLGFSLKGVLVKSAFGYGIDAMTLMLMRMFIAIPFFLVTLYVIEGKAAFQVTIRDLVMFAVMGILGIGGAMFFSFYSIELIDASLSTLVVFTYPSLTLIMLASIGKEKLSASKIISTLITFAGLTLVVRVDKMDFISVNGEGVIFGLIAAVCYAGYNASSEYALKKVSPVKLVAYCMFFVCGFFGVSFGVRPYPKTPEVWAIAAALGTVAGFFPFLLYNYGIKKIGAARTVIISSIGPVFTVLLAVIFLGERLGIVQVSGMVMIVFGVMTLKLQSPFKILRGSEKEIKESIGQLFAEKKTD